MSLKGIISKLYFDRSEVTQMSDDYFQNEVSQHRNEDEDIDSDIYNADYIHDKLSSINGVGKYAELGKIMLSMMKDIKNGDYEETPWFTIATVSVALLYLINPADIIPDFIPGLGYIDDVAVFSVSIAWIESDLHKYLDWKIAQGQGL